MYTTCSTLATDRVLVSILQSPKPHWRAQTCTLDVVQQLGETLKARGEGEEAKQRSVYTALISCTRRDPVVGSPHQTPDTSSDWKGLTSETSKNYGYFHPFWRNFHPKFRYVTESPNKSRPRWVGNQRSILCSVPCEIQ